MGTEETQLAELVPGQTFGEMTLEVRAVRLCTGRTGRFLRLTLCDDTDARTSRRFDPTVAECRAAQNSASVVASGRMGTRGQLAGELVLTTVRRPDAVAVPLAVTRTTGIRPVQPFPEQVYTDLMAQAQLFRLGELLLIFVRDAEREGCLGDSEVFESVLRRGLARAYACGHREAAARHGQAIPPSTTITGL